MKGPHKRTQSPYGCVHDTDRKLIQAPSAGTDSLADAKRQVRAWGARDSSPQLTVKSLDIPSLSRIRPSYRARIVAFHPHSHAAIMPDHAASCHPLRGRALHRRSTLHAHVRMCPRAGTSGATDRRHFSAGTPFARRGGIRQYRAAGRGSTRPTRRISPTSSRQQAHHPWAPQRVHRRLLLQNMAWLPTQAARRTPRFRSELDKANPTRKDHNEQYRMHCATKRQPAICGHRQVPYKGDHHRSSCPKGEVLSLQAVKEIQPVQAPRSKVDQGRKTHP